MRVQCPGISEGPPQGGRLVLVDGYRAQGDTRRGYVLHCHGGGGGGSCSILVRHCNVDGVGGIRRPVVQVLVRGAEAQHVGTRLSVVSAEPSAHLITTTCVSSVPGSVKDPLKVVDWFSLMGVALRVTLAGATFFTATVVEAEAAAPSLSVTVTSMV